MLYIKTKSSIAATCGYPLLIHSMLTGLPRPCQARCSYFCHESAEWRCKRHAFSDECAICLRGLHPQRAFTVSPCNHRFHTNCMLTWMKKSPTCPLCRTRVAAPMPSLPPRPPPLKWKTAAFSVVLGLTKALFICFAVFVCLVIAA